MACKILIQIQVIEFLPFDETRLGGASTPGAAQGVLPAPRSEVNAGRAGEHHERLGAPRQELYPCVSIPGPNLKRWAFSFFFFQEKLP